MERENTNVLHPTQFGCSIKCKVRSSDPRLKALLESGMNYRTALRHIDKMDGRQHEQTDFDYEANTPKGEWV